jgi:hypothetical protein
LLSVAVAANEAGVQFLDSPRRREADFGHSLVRLDIVPPSGATRR